MLQTLGNAWKIPNLRRKMLFTLFILFVYRVGSSIPVPFIDLEALKLFFELSAETTLGFVNLFTGGGLSGATIFAMSITPYINASIIMNLLTVAIPALERLVRDGGEEGRKKITNYTRYLTVVIGLIQGYSFYLLLRMNGFLERTDVWAAVVIVLTLTAGTAIVMWLGEHITERGVGNGISMILFAGIISRGPEMFNTIVNLYRSGSLKWYGIAFIIIGALFMVAFVVFMSNAERRIPIQYAKRLVGKKMYGGQSTHLPIKVNASGVMPIIFTSSIMSLPSTIAIFWKPEVGTWQHAFVESLSLGSPIYMIISLFLIIGFSYFYATIQFNPIEISNNLQKNGGSIPGHRPGKPTSDFITRCLGKITFIGAIFLGIIAILPQIIGVVFPSLSSISVGGTSVLIVVGVALDTVKQLESQMMMFHYKGFLE